MWVSKVKEKNHRPKMTLLVLKPMIPNLDLICDLIAVSTFPRNVILISQFGDQFLVSTNEVMCPVGPFHLPLPPQEEANSCDTDYYWSPKDVLA